MSAHLQSANKEWSNWQGSIVLALCFETKPAVKFPVGYKWHCANVEQGGRTWHGSVACPGVVRFLASRNV